MLWPGCYRNPAQKGTFLSSSMGTFSWSSDTNGVGFYRVVRDGAHLWGITNGTTLSGTVVIPVEVANGYGDLTSLSLTEDETPVNGAASQDAPIPLPLQLTVDTTQMSNGVHQISASARWDNTNGGLWEADSSPVTVNVYNEISFPNWMPRFGELGDTLMISVQSVHTNADWYIDIYDSQSEYIGTLGGHTDDGIVEGYWDLMDYYGVTHTNDDYFDMVVTTVYTNEVVAQNAMAKSSGICTEGTSYSSQGAPRLWKVTDPWSGSGAWVAVAQHAWDGAIDNDLLYGELGGFIGGAQSAGWTVMPSPQGQNDYGSWLAYGLTFGAGNSQGDIDWQAFRNAIYNASSRDLVYFGHGGPNGIGYNPANTNRYITSTEIANRLHTIPAGQTNWHAFRFVFLDGCSTAKGNLPEAFGILHRKITIETRIIG
jgi:hypothetical protein